MAKNKEKRFIRIFFQSGMSGATEIWVDRQTGVNYMFHQSGYSGGLTPLLDAEGKVIVTPVTKEMLEKIK